MTMFTVNYKGAYIHAYCDRPQCRVQFGGTIKGPFPSLDRAKWYIRQAIKNGDWGTVQ